MRQSRLPTAPAALPSSPSRLSVSPSSAEAAASGDPPHRARCHRALGLLIVLTPAVFAIISAAVTAPAHAGAIAAPPSDPDQLDRVFDNLRNWLVGLLAALATLMFTVGGVRYLLAGGDPGEAQKAKAAWKGAALGYGLAMLAPLLVNVLKRVVGG
ncbi:pilin [Sphaerisporangium sp. TRM90804]|nr:pilin [Sphaerisporangium sp. TRM90804]MDH2426475.1 pilin [Sphaerisporangium sp. TRM90804]